MRVLERGRSSRVRLYYSEGEHVPNIPNLGLPETKGKQGWRHHSINAAVCE